METYVEVCKHFEKEIKRLKEHKDDGEAKNSAGITENLITDTMTFISKLKSEFDKRNLKFTYPAVFPGKGNIGVEWANEKLEMYIDTDEKSDLVDVVASAPHYSGYYEKWHRKNIDFGFVEWIVEALK